MQETATGQTFIGGSLAVTDQGFLNTPVAIQAFVGGNATFTVGNAGSTLIFNGTPSASLASGISGKIILREGNGTNAVTFENTPNVSTPTFNVQGTFGNGTNTVTLNGTNPVVLTGTL